jgi:hyperosmotically inducible protein
MTILKTGLASLFFCGALAASPQLSHAGERADEARIETKLKKDRDLNGVRVKCESVVTLTGKVASESDKARAGRLAGASGFTKVDNQIEVSDKVIKDRLDDRAEAAKDRTQERADIEKNRIDAAAQAAKDRLDRKETGKTQTSIGDDVSDAWITTKLKSFFTTDSAFKDSSIRVDTDSKGMVTLDGTVPSDAAHMKALEVARTTKGVHDIRDNLKVTVPNR